MQKISKDPKKADHNMSDAKCLVCGSTLFIDDTNPCRHCQFSFIDKDNCYFCPFKGV